jgi:hypothetical protein
MKCPKCKLENPPSAMICDCGYNFETKALNPEKALKSSLDSISNFNEVESIWKKLLWAFWGCMAIAFLRVILLVTKVSETFLVLPFAIVIWGAFIFFMLKFAMALKMKNYQIVIVLVSCFTCVFWLSFAWVYGIYINKKKEFWKER